MPIIAGIVGYLILTMLNVREVTTENDFITAMLHSDGVYVAVEKVKTAIAISVFALGFCLGVITFGIGILLGRLKRMGG